MHSIRRTSSALVVALVAGACATTPVRNPLVDVPPGNYVLVEPQAGGYNAIAINEGAFTMRSGDRILSGRHWVDEQGRIHSTFDTGPCAGQESIWTYRYAGDRIMLNLVEDLCPVRNPALPQRMVYERR